VNIDNLSRIFEISKGTISLIGINDVGEVIHIDPFTLREPGFVSGNVLWLLPGDRGYLQGITYNKGSFDVGVRIVLVGVMEEHGVETSVAILSREHACIHEHQILIPLSNRQNSSSLMFLTLKHVRLSLETTAAIILISMISSKGIESRQLIPSSTDFLLLLFGNILVGILEETANISSSQWDTEHVEVHDTCYGVLHILPRSVVIT
jgi:hypothetical protein